jgi:hypothetical protein
MSVGAVASFAARPGLRQFAKFCIVGFSSTVIDFTVFNLCCAWDWPRRRADLLVPRRRLERLLLEQPLDVQAARGDAKKQYPKFVATNAWAGF